MKIALAQVAATSDIEANIGKGLALVEQAADAGAALILFPELAFMPFFPRERRRGPRPDAEQMPGALTDRFEAVSARRRIVSVINHYEQVGERRYDASAVIDADGGFLGVTRMAHIADFEGFHEKDYYDFGPSEPPRYDTAVGDIGIAICYDRHFPEYMRALASADLVLIPQAGVSAEWPEGMYEAEVRVAAFQNGYFAALANRVGREGELDFEGRSFVCDPSGRMLAQAEAGREQLLLVDLDLKALESCPARRLFLSDRRGAGRPLPRP